MRAALAAPLALAALAACDVRTVPVAQAARDLGCAPADVRITVGLHLQIARGCGRAVTYELVCRGDEDHCRFESVRSWAVLPESLLPGEGDAVAGEDLARQ